MARPRDPKRKLQHEWTNCMVQLGRKLFRIDSELAEQLMSATDPLDLFSLEHFTKAGYKSPTDHPLFMDAFAQLPEEREISFTALSFPEVENYGVRRPFKEFGAFDNILLRYEEAKHWSPPQLKKDDDKFYLYTPEYALMWWALKAAQERGHQMGAWSTARTARCTSQACRTRIFFNPITYGVAAYQPLNGKAKPSTIADWYVYTPGDFEDPASCLHRRSTAKLKGASRSTLPKEKLLKMVEVLWPCR